MENQTQKKTPLGLDQNIEGLLCYLGMWVTGIIFYIIDKENKFVRFHAIQSIITFLGFWILKFVVGYIPFIGGLINFILNVGLFLVWVLLMYKAYKGETYKLPVIGDIAEQQVNK